jgi:integrase
VHTGLRRSELAALKWTDVFLEVAKPYVKARASTTKNGEMAILYLHPELVAVLRELKTKAAPDAEFVFHVPRIERFRRDLKKRMLPTLMRTATDWTFTHCEKLSGQTLRLAACRAVWRCR